MLLRRSTTKGKATPLVRRWWRTPKSVPCQSHTLPKPRRRTAETALEGVLECCSGSITKRRHWYGGCLLAVCSGLGPGALPALLTPYISWRSGSHSWECALPKPHPPQAIGPE